MNKKSTRSNARTPVLKPSAAIAPSATLAVDGEFPLSASNGASAPEPLAAHDVLQAAMAPREDGSPDTVPPEASQETGAAAPDAAGDSEESGEKSGKKNGKKPAKAADQPVKEAAKEKTPKDKFVKMSFTLPESEVAFLDALKKTHQANGVALKKSQLLRAALLALADVDSARLTQLVAHLPGEPAAKKKK